MKYKLIKDIGLCKAPQILEPLNGFGVHSAFYIEKKPCSSTRIVFEQDEIALLIEQGYIQEISEHHWTDADMIDFADFIYSHWKHGGGFPSNGKLFHLWSQEKGVQSK